VRKGVAWSGRRPGCANRNKFPGLCTEFICATPYGSRVYMRSASSREFRSKPDQDSWLGPVSRIYSVIYRSISGNCFPERSINILTISLRWNTTEFRCGYYFHLVNAKCCVFLNQFYGSQIGNVCLIFSEGCELERGTYLGKKKKDRLPEMHALQSKCPLIAINTSWHVGNRQIHEDLGVTSSIEQKSALGGCN
jgi:hypothetical protein